MIDYVWVGIYLVISQIILALVGLYFYVRLDRTMKTLVAFFVIACLVGITTQYMAMNRIENVWLMNLFTLFEYSMLALVFSFWQKNYKIRRMLQISIPFYLIFSLTRNMLYGRINTLDNFAASLSTLLITGMVLYTLIDFQKDGNASIREPRFWVSTIVLISYGGNTILNSIGPIPDYSFLAWSIRNLIFISANLAYAGGFFWYYRSNFG